MGGGAWKVAYADFVTAMMAFFLLMWILNMSSEETKAGLAKYFTEGAEGTVNVMSPVGTQVTDPSAGAVGKLSTQDIEQRNIQRNYISLIRAINKEINAENIGGTPVSGMNTDGKGVTLQLTPDLMFSANSVELAPQGLRLLEKIVGINNKYDTYLVVRGHADASETDTSIFPTKWDLSAARANAAVKHLIEKGINPKRIRSIAYGDTQPTVPKTTPDAQKLNGRVEFSFHRGEVISDIGSF